MNRFPILLMALWALALGVKAQPLNIDKDDFNTETADYFLREAGSLIDEIKYGKLTDSMVKRADFTVVTHLEKALLISQNLTYEEGLEQSFPMLVDYYEYSRRPSDELRIRRKMNGWLEEKKEDREVVENQVEVANIYFETGDYKGAVAEYDSASMLANPVAPDIYYKALKKKALSQQRYAENLKLAGSELKTYREAYSVARNYYQTALKEAEKRSSIDDQLWIHQMIARTWMDVGQYNDQVKENQRIVELVEQFQKKSEIVVARNNLAYALKYAGRIEEAIEMFGKVITDAQGRNLPIFEAQAYENRAILHQSRKEMDAAIGDFSHSSERYKKAGLSVAEARVLDFKAITYYLQSDIYNAQEANKKGILALIEPYLKDEELMISRQNITKLSQEEQNSLMEAYRTRSLILEEGHEYEEALDFFKGAQEIRTILDIAQYEEEQWRSQQILQMEQAEGKLALDHISAEMHELELAKANAETEIQKARASEAEKEKEASDAKAAKAQAELRVLRQRELTQKRERELSSLEARRKLEEERAQAIKDSLETENRIAMLEVEKEKAEADKANLKAEEERAKAETEKARRRSLLYILMALAVLIAVIVFALARLRNKNKRIAEQNSIISESKTVIEQEKEKSDQLLLNILPPAVATELKENGASAPRQYEEVSVIFTDFKGFTNIAERLSPEELVKTLDKIFLEFDLICEKNGLNRIKTIGDAYMAACGLPEPMDNHAHRTTRAAMEMRDYIARFNAELEPGQPKWAIRIGVNSGPVVAGVVGIRKFAYDIWGDTVNIASRMESSGEAGKVNISEATYELVKSKFVCNYRGKIEAKNKGKIGMYFVEKAM